MERLAIYSHSVQTDNIIGIVGKYFNKIEYYETDDENFSLYIVLEKKLFSAVKSLEIKVHKRKRPDYKLFKNNDPLVDRLLQLREMTEKITTKEDENQRIKEKLIEKINTLNTEIIVEAIPQFDESHQEIISEMTKEMKGIIFTGSNSLYALTAFWNYDGLCILNEKGHSMLKDYHVVIDSRFKMEEIYSDRQLARKDQSEHFMKEKRIPVDYLCPCIQDDVDTTIRSKEEVVSRALALYYVGLRGENYSIGNLKDIFKTYGLEYKLTPYEKATILVRNPTEDIMLAASWRFESMWVLLWALGYVEELSYPDEICDVHKIEKILFSMSEEEFAGNSEMVIRKKILDQADLYYRLYHFISKIEDLEETEYSDLIGGVIAERYYALMWLIRYENLSWDEVGECYDQV